MGAMKSIAQSLLDRGERNDYDFEVRDRDMNL